MTRRRTTRRRTTITLFVALLKSMIEQFHFLSLFSKVRLCNRTFWHSFQKCDCTIALFKRAKKNAIAWSLFLKEWMRENVQKSANVQITLFSLFKNGQLPNPDCWEICTLKICIFCTFLHIPPFQKCELCDRTFCCSFKSANVRSPFLVAHLKSVIELFVTLLKSAIVWLQFLSFFSKMWLCDCTFWSLFWKVRLWD